MQEEAAAQKGRKCAEGVDHAAGLRGTACTCTGRFKEIISRRLFVEYTKRRRLQEKKHGW